MRNLTPLFVLAFALATGSTASAQYYVQPQTCNGPQCNKVQGFTYGTQAYSVTPTIFSAPAAKVITNAPTTAATPQVSKEVASYSTYTLNGVTYKKTDYKDGTTTGYAPVNASVNTASYNVSNPFAQICSGPQCRAQKSYVQLPNGTLVELK